MGYATLGDFQFRIDPDSIDYNYKVDYAVINTIGGQVVQVLGATTSDITIHGSFGQDHKNKKESWQLAEEFHAKIRQLMDKQLLPNQGTGQPVHQPLRFSFMDGVHNYDFKVLIKSVADADDDGSIEHKSGKFSYHYTLTLFLVEDASLNLKKITTDQFIARIATNGLGWKNLHYGSVNNSFEGDDSLGGAIKYIQDHSDDGTFVGYVTKVLEGNDPGGKAVFKSGPVKAQ